MFKSVLSLALIAVCVVAHSLRSVDFTPTPLPCQYRITSNADGMGGSLDNVLTGNDKLYMKKSVAKQGDQEVTTQILIRSDLTKEEEGVVKIRRFTARIYAGQRTCNAEWVTEEQANDTKYDIAPLTHKETFDSSREVEEGGEKYTVYRLNDEEGYMDAYVDKKGRITKLTMYAEGMSSTTKYAYSNAGPLEDFVIDKSISDKCPEEAYVAPKESICPEPEPEDSAASLVPMVALFLTLVGTIVSFL